jgi:hypothetical protein
MGRLYEEFLPKTASHNCGRSTGGALDAETSVVLAMSVGFVRQRAGCFKNSSGHGCAALSTICTEILQSKMVSILADPKT